MTSQPPHLTLTSRWLARASAIMADWPRPLAWCCVAAAVGLVLLLQLWLGRQYSINAGYVLAMALTAWCLEERAALAVGGFAAVASSLIIGVQHAAIAAPYRPSLRVELVNAGLRLFVFGLLVTFLAGMRAAFLIERWRGRVDGLTGALNKSAFEAEMPARVRAARTAGGALVLAYMDLDGFKEVNDRHGHAAGDRVLRAFAGAASQAIRDSDLFARIGGDEFAALLTVPSLAEGDRVAAMVHERVAAILAANGHGVTCSTGALVLDAAQLEESDSYLDLADKLMYEVKQAGKDGLRIGRANAVGAVLRSAFPPATDDELEIPRPEPPRLAAVNGRSLG